MATLSWQFSLPFQDSTPKRGGTYVFNNKTGTFEWVHPTTSSREEVHCPDGGYWSQNISDTPVFIRDREHKRKLLKENGLMEKNNTLTKKEL